jgi:8-oxo-dGTP pyrophosphatase MutT (NUDIX family)
MVASSILPITIHKGKIYFLFGKENEMEDSAPGFSDFGGRVDEGESIIETAFREGSEELCGFLGDSNGIKTLLKSGVYKITHENYHVHIFLMKYDPNLPCYFTNNHRFLWERMDKNILNDSKYFEKQEIRWFSVKDIRDNKHLFRDFYRKIIDVLMNEIKAVYIFVKKGSKGSICSLSKTKKKNKGG